MKFISSVLLAGSLSLFAAPEGMRVVHGEVTQEGEVIHSGDKALLEWDTFSIERDERLHFEQQDEGSTVLNRVTGNDESHIHGLLSSNGSVYLINPNGVLIGTDARIETAGFVASSLDLLNEDFLNEKHHFSGLGGGAVINLGTIACDSGDIALLGRLVHNHGTLSAPRGHVGLGVGAEILLQPKQHPYILIRAMVPGEGQEEGVSLMHGGRLEALTVELRSGSSVYAKAIQSTGMIEALGVEKRNGEIYLVADKGICEVEGMIYAPQGTVHVLGEKVGLLGNASIDVSGKEGGGTVLVGGDYQGKNPEIPNAEAVFAGQDTQVKADALEKGDGGKIIFWSDKVTRHYGLVSARGGELGGDGGFMEVSSKGNLDYQGFARGEALIGTPATLLLDPSDIVIAGAATTGSFTGCGSPPSTYTITTGTATNQILAANLVTQLGSCNVLISTMGAGGSGPNGGSITVSSAVTWSADTALTLQAASFFTASAAITNSTSSSAGITIYASGVGATTNPAILLSTGGVLTTKGGPIILTGTSSAVASSGHGVRINSGQVVTTSGNVTITGIVPVGATNAVQGVLFSTNNPIQSSGGAITISGTSRSTAASSHGVNANAGSWNTLTGTATLAFTNCQGGTGTGSHGVNLGQTLTTTSSVSFTNCVGGVNGTTGGNGVNVAAALSAQGAITGTTCNGAGNGGVGFKVGATVSTTTGDISITGSALGTTGAAHGIFLTSTLSTSSGAVTLNGISGASNTASNGVRLSVANPIGATNSITLTGTSLSTVSASHGVNIASAWVSSDTGTLTLTGTGGSTGTSAGVLLNASLTHPGPIILSGTGASPNLIQGNSTITTTGQLITLSQPVSLSTSISCDTTNSGGTPAGAAISFNSSILGSASLTLTAGTGGAISLLGNVGTSLLATLQGITFSSGSGLTLGNSGGTTTIYIAGDNFSPTMPIALAGDIAFSSLSASFNFGGAITGAQSVTVDSTVGAVTFNNVGTSGTRLTSLSCGPNITGMTLGNGSTASTIYVGTGGFNYTALETITLGGDVTIDSNSGAVVFGVPLDDSVLGTHTLTLNLGGSTASLAGVGQTISPAGLVISNGDTDISSGAVLVTGDITTNSNLTVGGGIACTHFTASPGAYAISLQGGGTISSTATFNNTGTTLFAGSFTFSNSSLDTTTCSSTTIQSGDLVLSNSGSTVTFGPTIFLNNGTTAAATLTTNNGAITMGTFSLAGDSSVQFFPFSVTSGGGPIVFSSTIDASVANTQSLTVATGGGSLSFGGNIGAGTALGDLLILSGNANFPGVLNIGSLTITSGSATLNNTTTVRGPVTCTNLTANGGAYAVSFQQGGTITGTAIFNNTGAITFGGYTPGWTLTLSNSALNTTSGSSTTIQGGTVLLSHNGSAATFGSTTFDGTGSPPILTTNQGAISIGGTTLTGGSAQITSGGGSITFTGSISGAQGLTLAAGTGAITLGGDIGVTGTRLTNLTFTSGSGLTIGPSAVFVTGGFAPAMPVILAGTTSITTTNTPISFSSTIEGMTSYGQSLTVSPGTGAVTFNSSIGLMTPINVFNVTRIQLKKKE